MWKRIISSPWALGSYITNGSPHLVTSYSSGISTPCNEIGLGDWRSFWILFTCFFDEFFSGSINRTCSSWISRIGLHSTWDGVAFGSSSVCCFNLFRVFLTSLQHQCYGDVFLPPLPAKKCVSLLQLLLYDKSQLEYKRYIGMLNYKIENLFFWAISFWKFEVSFWWSECNVSIKWQK